MPTILDLHGHQDAGIKFDGRSLVPLHARQAARAGAGVLHHRVHLDAQARLAHAGVEAIHALEPDFHFKPEVELYNLIDGPGGERATWPSKEPEVVAMLEARMQAHIAKREKETGRHEPDLHQPRTGTGTACGPFKTSQQAYDTLHIGSPEAAQELQEAEKARREIEMQRGAKV